MECQVGALFTINGQVVGLECFGPQKTLGQFFPKLVQSYTLDALDWLEEAKETQIRDEDGRRLLEGLRRVPGKPYSSLGRGENVRFQDDSFSGAALVHEGRVLHLSAFSHFGHKNDRSRVPFQRFSQRRRRE